MNTPLACPAVSALLRKPRLPSITGPGPILSQNAPEFLLQGDSVSLHHVWQAPITWSEHQHTDAQIMILFSPAVCRMRWRSSCAEWKESLVNGPAMILLPPKLTHAPQWNCEAELIDFYIKPALFKRFTGGAEVLAALDEPIPFPSDDFFIWQTFSVLRHFLRRHPRPDRFYVDAVGGLVTGHLVWRLRNSPQINKAAATFSPKKLSSILEHLHGALRANVNVEDLARRAGLSRAHFAEMFKNTTGSTPYDYLIRCRVLHAQDLLSSGNHCIGEVAEDSGFYDQSHLGRHFKKLLGVSPKTYCTQMRTLPKKRTD